TEKENALMAACLLGRNLLENGGEIYRVEESINFFLTAYGMCDCQIFAIPASIMVTITEADVPLTRIERVKSTSQNLDKLSKFNDLCRTACKDTPPISYILARMEEIRQERPYSFKLDLLAYGCAGAFFCLFWGGTLADGIVAFICGLATKYCLGFMSRFKPNIFFLNLVSSAAIAYIAMAFVSVGIADNYDKIIIGAIMALVPGVAVTNVMRDIIAGDLITGTTKLSEVLLVATSIAIGIALAISSIRWLGGVL
ncbi:MAG: threonine/serine exporter family protein, partial [Oscillospiraceae bacterium]